MKVFCFLLLIVPISLLSCKSIIHDDNYCEITLDKISYATYGSEVFGNIKINIELSDSTTNIQNIRLYVMNPDSENSTTTVGWLKIDKKKNEIYNITYDEKSLPHKGINRKVIKDYTDNCLI